jgi:hypothetical protein
MQQAAEWHDQQTVPIPQLQQHSVPRIEMQAYIIDGNNATSYGQLLPSPQRQAVQDFNPRRSFRFHSILLPLLGAAPQPSFDQLPSTIRHNQTDLLLSTPGNLQSIGVNHSAAKRVKVPIPLNTNYKHIRMPNIQHAAFVDSVNLIRLHSTRSCCRSILDVSIVLNGSSI